MKLVLSLDKIVIQSLSPGGGSLVKTAVWTEKTPEWHSVSPCGGGVSARSRGMSATLNVLQAL